MQEITVLNAERLLCMVEGCRATISMKRLLVGHVTPDVPTFNPRTKFPEPGPSYPQNPTRKTRLTKFPDPPLPRIVIVRRILVKKNMNKNINSNITNTNPPLVVLHNGGRAFRDLRLSSSEDMILTKGPILPLNIHDQDLPAGS